jgi:hypothetical protein
MVGLTSLSGAGSERLAGVSSDLLGCYSVTGWGRGWPSGWPLSVCAPSTPCAPARVSHGVTVLHLWVGVGFAPASRGAI